MGFEVLFEKGRVFEKATVEPIDAGTLRITSGTVAVCDPSSPGEKGILERSVPNGTYPVLVSRGHFPKNDVHAIAAAMVKFTDRRVVEWQPALPKGEDPATLEPGEYFGYGVDAGIACFVDGSLASKLDFDHFDVQIVPKLEAIGPRDGYGEVPIEDGSLVAFNTGAGDGLYVSFWGFDAKGDLAALCTEFRVAGTEETKGEQILKKYWPGTPPPSPSLAPLFEVGRVFRGGEVLRVEALGKIDLPSGVLLVGPSALPEVEETPEEEEPEEDLEPEDPTRRHFVLEGLPSGSFEVRISVNKERRGKQEVELAGAIYIAFSDAKPTSWDTAVPSNLGQGVSLSFDPGYGSPLGLYDGSLKVAIDQKDNQATMRAAVGGDDKAWKAAPVDVELDGTKLRSVVVRADVSSDYVFIGRAEDGSICCVVVPVSRCGNEVTRSMTLAEMKRKELAGKPDDEDDAEE
jgi:hypothetical protein